MHDPYLRPKNKFDKKDIIRILTELSFPFSKPEVEQWIWEVDEDLDEAVNEYEFTLMYKRCIFDKTGLEPRNLFNLVQFLMYDIAGRGKITVEDTLELIYVRYQDQLEEHIRSIFGEKEKTEDGQEREVLYDEYLAQMRKKDLENRKRLEEERKTVTKVNLKKDD